MEHHLKTAAPGLADAVTLILDRAAAATPEEVPGLVAALESLLAADERPAASIVAAARAEQ